jgi:hypothetical protein
MSLLLIAFIRNRIQKSEKIKGRLEQLKVPKSVLGFKLF